jgi:hypothetical protein
MPWEVSKYRNQISRVETAEAVVGKCSGLTWLPFLSWESSPLALPNPFPVGPKAILAPQEPLWASAGGLDDPLLPGSLWVCWRFLYPDCPQFRGEMG